MRERPLIALLLVLLTLAVFAQVRGHDFVDFDDVKHIVENPDAAPGLEPARVLRVFTRPHYGDFVPLTYLSLQLDRTLFGTGPAGTLLVNVALHAASAVALFLALARMTGATGRSAFVAAVWAVHPLGVESVAWAFERKDVLSGFFAMLALWCYARAVERAPIRDDGRGREAGGAAIGAVTACLAAGLLAKPMLVTLPFALLLLDHWPLGRLRGAGAWPDPTRLTRAAAEKWPLFAIAAAGVAMTLLGHASASLPEATRMSPGVRFGWTLDAYAFYVAKTLWPSSLAVYYPHAFDAVPLGRAVAAGAALVLVTGAALRLEPGYVTAMNNLAYLLATAEDPAVRDPAEAMSLAEAALRALGEEEPALLDTLAAAQAAAGRIDDAIASASRAAALAAARGDAALEAELRRNLERYRAQAGRAGARPAEPR